MGKMKKPCKDCPFKRDNSWCGGVNKKLIAFSELERQKIFSCHMINEINVVSDEDMVIDDCVGFKQMKANTINPDTYPNVVNHFNETSPKWDLTNIVEDWKNSIFLKPLYHNPL